MVLEVENKKVGGYAGMVGASENHKRAALDFVAELTGSPRAGSDKKAQEHNDSLVHADELPVPMFGVDLDMRCVFWNKSATDNTGWTEADVCSMPNFTASLFRNLLSCEKDCEDLLKAVIEGENPIQEVWNMKTKWGQNMNSLLLASTRTDGFGVICGTVCVIMPLGVPQTKQPTLKVDCDVGVMDDVSQLDSEEGQLNNEDDSPRDSEDQFLAAMGPPSPYSDTGGDAMDMFGDLVNTEFEAEGTSVCSQDWCKSEQCLETVPVTGSNLGHSSLTRARAMVVDPEARRRKPLTLMLERCGFEVSTARSASEALWFFEQSMQDPEGFSIVFINLNMARAEDYLIVRELRKIDQPGSSSPTLTGAFVLVAVADLDRWQDSTQKDVAAGLDAVMNYPLRVQQLRDTLNSLDIPIDHLDFANKSPRATFNSWNNPLILAR